MTLNEKQAEFTRTLALFIAWCFRTDQQVVLAEVFRPPELAAIYAKQGRGIKNSVHTKKLAADMFRLKDGGVSWDRELYEPLGKKWKTMHSLARWGGDFKRRDCVHFSFIHRGIM